MIAGSSYSESLSLRRDESDERLVEGLLSDPCTTSHNETHLPVGGSCQDHRRTVLLVVLLLAMGLFLVCVFGGFTAAGTWIKAHASSKLLAVVQPQGTTNPSKLGKLAIQQITSQPPQRHTALKPEAMPAHVHDSTQPGCARYKGENYGQTDKWGRAACVQRIQGTYHTCEQITDGSCTVSIKQPVLFCNQRPMTIFCAATCAKVCGLNTPAPAPTNAPTNAPGAPGMNAKEQWEQWPPSCTREQCKLLAVKATNQRRSEILHLVGAPKETLFHDFLYCVYNKVCPSNKISSHC